MSSRTEDAGALRLMFLLVVVASILFARAALDSLDVDLSGADRAASMLGLNDQPKRVRDGYVPRDDSHPVAPAQGATGDAPAVALASSSSTTAAGAQAAPTAVPTASAQPTATGTAVRVANTDGLGLVLYTAPQKDARVPRGFLEGTRLTVLERQGDEWARVRGENGMEGWVTARYLVPAN